MGKERLKLVTFSSLYPSRARPTYAPFVETRLKELLRSHEHLQSVVVAPVGWLPFVGKFIARSAALAATPAEEIREGVRVLYPRFLPVPGLSGALKPFCMAAAALPVLARLRASGYDFDLIDAHYFYPDGVAAALLARYFGVPFIVTARGSDLNHHAGNLLPKQLMLWAARRASAIVTVSSALRDVATRIGMDGAKIRVLRNGVDAQRFQPLDRERIRRELGLDGFTLLSVGNLVPEKGHDLVLRSLPALDDATLLIAGDGPQRRTLEQLAAALGIARRVRFLGTVPQTQLVDFYSAADVLILASTREGWPNVLLESMACGTPVVAARVGGCPEIVTCPEAGALLDSRSPEAIVRAVNEIRARGTGRTATRLHAEMHSWEDASRGQAALINAALQGRPNSFQDETRHRDSGTAKNGLR